ncbi:hypothetical protein TNCV_4689371 [Trichonephila clavipes]|nr:hypothetical protein TNCV_4689371 [Trichonephila clavipes]
MPRSTGALNAPCVYIRLSEIRSFSLSCCRLGGVVRLLLAFCTEVVDLTPAQKIDSAHVAVGSLMVTASDSRPVGLGSIADDTKYRVHTDSMPKLWRWRLVVSPSIVPSGNFAELIRIVTYMVLKAKANDWRTSSPLPR